MSLSVQDKVKIRRFVATKAQIAGVPISWIKAAINAAADAINDLEDGTTAIQKADIAVAGTSLLALGSTLVDTATSSFGVTFTNQEKKWIRAKVLETNFIRDK